MAAMLTLSLPACNNSLGGFGGAVGNTPNTYAELSYFFTGTAGEPFTATVTDTQASWTVQGVTPFRVVLCNNTTPGAVQATKTANDNNLFEAEIFRGTHLAATATTSDPFGTVSGTTKKNFMRTAPPANPDVRIFVSGPDGEHFYGLVGAGAADFEINTIAPVVFMYENPKGNKVSGNFNQINSLGSFTIDMTVNGAVVATASGGPIVNILEP
ncbi:MAG: hypothetical protein ACREQI_01270 [Candidatus Binataceae bacterium]